MGRRYPGRGLRGTGTPRPGEPAIEPVTDDTQPGVGGAPSRPLDRMVVLAAGVALLLIVIVVVVSGGDERADQETPDDRDTPTTSGAATGDPSVGPVVITMDSTSKSSDVVTISASSGTGDGAPWVAFEICALGPPGCAPVWTEGLRQSGSTYLADVAVPDTFVAPDGFVHDCRDTEACELRVTTAATSVAFPVEVGGTSVAAEPESPVGPAGPELILPAGEVADGERTEVVVNGAPRGEVLEVAVCPAGVPDERCRSVPGYRADDVGTASFSLDVPRMMSGHLATPDGMVAQEIDCAIEICHLEVATSRGTTKVPVRFDAAAPARPAPLLRLDRTGPFDIGERLIVEGSGFPRFGSRDVERVRWVLCQTEPATLAAVGRACGTPRVVQATAVGPDGSFLLALRVPDPASIRTWVDNETLTCEPRCRLVVLADPFPWPIAIPIEFT